MSPGSAYDHYQIIRLLGHGAMGTVYLATETELGAQIALKIVHRGPDRDDQEIVAAERLGAELQKRLAAVDSRVCRVHRYSENIADLNIEMEYVEGDDLSTILASGPMAPGMAVRVAIELCEMLENLKAFTACIDGKEFTGVIHGDLKPKNIRLTRQNQIKVLDFGIAKALSRHPQVHDQFVCQFGLLFAGTPGDAAYGCRLRSVVCRSAVVPDAGKQVAVR